MHIVAIALSEPVLSSSEAALQVILAPEAPNGWPIEIAPPSKFTLLASIPNSLIHARLWEENASLSSKISTSSKSHPALSRHSNVEATGPIPIYSGAQPVTAVETILASGWSEFCLANSSLQIIAKTAPSVNGEEVAAVTEPPSLNTGVNFLIDSKLLSCRIQPSSEATSSYEKTLQISALKLP